MCQTNISCFISVVNSIYVCNSGAQVDSALMRQLRPSWCMPWFQTGIPTQFGPEDRWRTHTHTHTGTFSKVSNQKGVEFMEAKTENVEIQKKMGGGAQIKRERGWWSGEGQRLREKLSSACTPFQLSVLNGLGGQKRQWREKERESYRKYDTLMAHINNTAGPNKMTWLISN